MDEQFALHPLVSFMRDPVRTTQRLNAESWSSLLRGARRSNLLCKAACLALDMGLENQLPAKILFHFRSAQHVARSSRDSALREIGHIEHAFAKTQTPCILLKGAAYVASNLVAGKGRLMTDIDIMVPREQLISVETAMVHAGWVTTKIEAYDQRYYREWMHELPPMRHRTRGTSLDIHHTILPPTARLKPDVSLLWKDARKLSASSYFLVLAPVDLILHSATHLFHEGEFANGLRDLFDIDSLLKEFSSSVEFWEGLIFRAEQLDLGRPLYYALRYCSRVIGTLIPAFVWLQLVRFTPPAPLGNLMDHLIMHSLGTVLELSPPRVTAPALFGMYVRSHYLRMPIRQLIPHLVRKQFRVNQE